MNYLLNLVKTSYIQNLFLLSGQGNFNVTKKLLEQIADARLPIPSVYKNQADLTSKEEELRQEFFVKILKGKICWEPKKGKLTTYILVIVNRMWQDLFKKKVPLNTTSLQIELDQLPRQTHTITSTSNIIDQWLQDIENLSRGKTKLIIKMWIPDRFAFNFDSELQEIFPNSNIHVIKAELKFELDYNKRKGKNHCRAKVIAELLNMQSNTIDTMISRAKKKFLWLKHF